MPLTVDALRKAVARGERGGTWFLHGDEEYLKEEAVQLLIAAHLDPATRDFNLDQLRGPGLDPETLASVCQTPPMLAEWRVVVVREAQALAANARARSVLELLINRKLPGLAFVVVAQIDEKNTPRIWQQLAKNAMDCRVNALPQGELPDWLIRHAADAGVTLEPGAARALAAAAGPELGRLVQELHKLTDYAADRKRIEVEDVRALVGYVPRHNRWDWFDLVGDARFVDARHALATLLEADNAVGLLAGLGSQLLRIGVALTGGERATLEILPPHQRWLASRLARQARSWSLIRLDAALDDVQRADRLLKSSSLEEHRVMEELLLRLESRHTAAA